jgi:endo-1,4-beta-xylanase
MRFQAQFLAAVAVAPLVSAQLNDLAKAAGKLYFGTATDNEALNVTEYVQILSNTGEFGQLTPSNGKVCLPQTWTQRKS